MRKHVENIFPINRYAGPDYFCDRVTETDRLLSALGNGRNTLIIAPRRIGKSSLIHHCFHEARSTNPQVRCLFLDIYSARNLREMNALLLNAAAEMIAGSNSSIADAVWKFFQSLRPVVSFNPFTGLPEISISSDGVKQDEQNLSEIFMTLDRLGYPVYIAIDEFQQIEEFPERAAALLRTVIQRTSNLRFIFSGSARHLLANMFASPSAPFYASSDTLDLQRIDADVYTDFIVNQFKKVRKSISKENARYMVDWCRTHTYYVQVLCNRVHAAGGSPVTREQITQVMLEVIREQDPLISSIRRMLAVNQWELFVAICLEGSVVNYTSSAFMHTYKLSSSAAMVSALTALVDKEMIYESGVEEESGKAIYEPYNVFFAQWVRHRHSAAMQWKQL